MFKNCSKHSYACIYTLRTCYHKPYIRRISYTRFNNFNPFDSSSDKKKRKESKKTDFSKVRIQNLLTNKDDSNLVVNGALMYNENLKLKFGDSLIFELTRFVDKLSNSIDGDNYNNR